MKIQVLALAAALIASPVTSFTLPGSVKKSAFFDTSLKNGMDAYDAQMRALAANQPLASPVSTTTSTTTSTSTSASTTSYSDSSTSMLDPDNFKLSQRWRKKTKQLATLGPASSSFEMIEKLFLAGADVFRLNFSHGEHAQKKELLDIIRQVEQKYDHPIAVLGDLQGPKLRVGQFANPQGELLQKGQLFRFDLDGNTPGTHQRVQLPHPEIIEASQVGHVLLIDDGKVKMQVIGTGPGYIDCEVLVPGRIKDKKVRVVHLGPVHEE